MSRAFVIDRSDLRIADAIYFVFDRRSYDSVKVSPDCQQAVVQSFKGLQEIIQRGVPLYGVTTGYGDSCSRVISADETQQLQKNLISFLLCGSGEPLPRETARAILLLRLKSLSRGYSGVSLELVDRMRLYLENDWLPLIPRQGSLGASGDLVPLSYLAQILQGKGTISAPEGELPAADLLLRSGLSPYRLKAKEGLALVNGTTAMAGVALVNYHLARSLTGLSTTATAWTCLALRGRPEAFGTLVNETARRNPGQAYVARAVRSILAEEGYEAAAFEAIRVTAGTTDQPVQNKYSLRCAPQILGPVQDTLDLVQGWLELEINSTSDNPIVGEDGAFAMGGNFYGGYLVHAMDYLKICIGHVADLADRQAMLIIDEKSNAGLPPNLAAWDRLAEKERFLHHGLKGLNIAISAITADILCRATPAGLFSRSSEAHNQDKVSMGMNSAIQCSEMLRSAFTVQAMQLVALTQALDLRGVTVRGAASSRLYALVRRHVAFVERDRPLGEGIERLAGELVDLARSGGLRRIDSPAPSRRSRRRPGA